MYCNMTAFWDETVTEYTFLPQVAANGIYSQHIPVAVATQCRFIYTSSTRRNLSSFIIEHIL